MLALGLVGCEPSPAQQQEKLEAEVITLHDSAMARMGEISLRKEMLAQLQDSLGKANPEITQQVAPAIDSLAAADEAMWKWMRAYKPDRQEAEGKTKYLEQEKAKMEQVWRRMENSLTRAKSLQNQLSTPQK